jgi:predicted nuclease of predicted toxin-antitoxin system
MVAGYLLRDGNNMEKLIAAAAYGIQAIMMRTFLIGQDLVFYDELKAMFGGDYPPDVWNIFADINNNTTRKSTLERLRVIAAKYEQGAMFAAALDPAELASLSFDESAG